MERSNFCRDPDISKMTHSREGTASATDHPTYPLRNLTPCYKPPTHSLSWLSVCLLLPLLFDLVPNSFVFALLILDPSICRPALLHMGRLSPRRRVFHIDGWARRAHAFQGSGSFITDTGPAHFGAHMLNRLVTFVVAVSSIVLAVPASIVVAQIDPQVRDRVVPAVVEIAIIFDVTENGATEPSFCPSAVARSSPQMG